MRDFPCGSNGSINEFLFKPTTALSIPLRLVGGIKMFLVASLLENSCLTCKGETLEYILNTIFAS